MRGENGDRVIYLSRLDQQLREVVAHVLRRQICVLRADPVQCLLYPSRLQHEVGSRPACRLPANLDKRLQYTLSPLELRHLAQLSRCSLRAGPRPP